MPTAGARQQRFHFFREVLHLIFDFLALEAALLEPCVEGEILVAASFLDSHDLRRHFRRRSEERDFLLEQQIGIDLLRGIEFFLIGIGEH